MDAATRLGDTAPDQIRVRRAATFAGELVESISAAIRAPRSTLTTSVACLLGGGHLLIEDVPGVGKTMLAKSLARAAGCHFARLQCTSDLLPSDVTGVHVYDQKEQSFTFRPGPVFTNILLADEINRASPKTQSALLESMEEQQVTVEGHTRALPSPFMVVATMNPIEYEGTFALPEAQLDRFAASVSIGYPDHETEAAMLMELAHANPLDHVAVVGDAEAVADAIAACADVHVDPSVADYVTRLVAATRRDDRLVIGASPRAGLTLLRIAQASALIGGHDAVYPDHVKLVAGPVLGHRLILASSTRVSGLTGADIVRDVLDDVPVPGF